MRGNYIGTNIAGTVAIRNKGGVVVNSGSSNLIEGNLISGNGNTFSDWGGVWLQGAGASGNIIRGNYIGTDATGTFAIQNVPSGVHMEGGANNTIGGIRLPGALCTSPCNLISGNRIGIDMVNIGNYNSVLGNYIGTNADGTNAIGNNSFGQIGILLGDGTTNALIGGPAPGAGNVISGNPVDGIELIGNPQPTDNQIQGNYIGTNAAGTAAIANGVGVFVSGEHNQIGGQNRGEGNLISGNWLHGINLQGGLRNLVLGNYIGTNADGTAAIANLEDGVLIVSSHNNMIGDTPRGGNLISGNAQWGVVILGAPGEADNNIVLGNSIGTKANGSAAIPNGWGGVYVRAPNTRVGGITYDFGLCIGVCNRIAFNLGLGVDVRDGTGNAIRGNAIYANGDLGIDLNEDGVTLNDIMPGDWDTGPNKLQNFPILSAVSSNVVQGTFNSTPNATFTLEFFYNTVCDPSTYGEGETPAGWLTITTDNNGNVYTGNNLGFTYQMPIAVPHDSFITVTATDAGNNTSEFSPCILASACSVCDSALASWQVVDPLPYPPVSSPAVASDGLYAYAVGGLSNQTLGPTDRFARFLPPSGLWEILQPVPDAHGASAAVYSPINNKLYVFGGIGASFNALAATRIYDGVSWSTGAVMPAPRFSMGAGYYGGRICLAGGSGTVGISDAKDTFWCYDVINDRWEVRASLPQPVTGPGAGVINAKFYIVAGVTRAATT